MQWVCNHFSFSSVSYQCQLIFCTSSGWVMWGMFLSDYFLSLRKDTSLKCSQAPKRKILFSSAVFETLWSYATIKCNFVLDLPQKMQIIVLVNTPGDTKVFRPINSYQFFWRKSPNESETTFLISIKFHRKENNGKLEGLFHSNIMLF